MYTCTVYKHYAHCIKTTESAADKHHLGPITNMESYYTSLHVYPIKSLPARNATLFINEMYLV